MSVQWQCCSVPFEEANWIKRKKTTFINDKFSQINGNPIWMKLKTITYSGRVAMHWMHMSSLRCCYSHEYLFQQQINKSSVHKNIRMAQNHTARILFFSLFHYRCSSIELHKFIYNTISFYLCLLNHPFIFIGCCNPENYLRWKICMPNSVCVCFFFVYCSERKRFIAFWAS